MIPARVNLTETRGDTWRITLTLDDGAEVPTPLDLTGATALAQVRPNPNSRLALTFDVVNAPLGADGVIQLAMTESQDVPWLKCGDGDPVECSWDCQVETPAGVDTYAAGVFLVRPDTARADS